MNHLSVNSEAMKIVRKILQFPDFYSVSVKVLPNKVTILDGTNGSFEFGRLVGEICMGGFGTCQFTDVILKEIFTPGLIVHTSHPVMALIGSQKAEQLSVKIQKNGKDKKYKYMVSGPFRAKTKLDSELFDLIRYSDDSDESVIIFEADLINDENLINEILKKCKLEPENTFAIFTPTNSIPGTIQIAARIIKTGIHILRELNFNPHYIKYGMGISPIAPIAKDNLQAMGRTNDSIIYGGRVYLTVDVPKEEEPEMIEILSKCPSNISSSYGKPFYQIMQDVNFDFSKVDSKLFAPAVLTINNMRTGKCYTAGKINDDILWNSYFS